MFQWTHVIDAYKTHSASIESMVTNRELARKGQFLALIHHIIWKYIHFSSIQFHAMSATV